MALAPADFYAYSRATGVPVPEDPEERAEMAPEVLAFRRNQLKTPESQGPDPLSIGIGLGLAAAGLGGAAFGLNRLFRGAGKGQTTTPAGANLVDLTKVAEARIPEVPKQTTPPQSKPYTPSKPIADPWSGTVPTKPTQVTTQTTYALKPSTTDLTSAQQQELPTVIKQNVQASDPGLDQVINRNVVVPQQREVTPLLSFLRDQEQIARNAALEQELQGFPQEAARNAAVQGKRPIVSGNVWEIEDQLEELSRQAEQYYATQEARWQQGGRTVSDLTGEIEVSAALAKQINKENKEIKARRQAEEYKAIVSGDVWEAEERLKAIKDLYENEITIIRGRSIPLSQFSESAAREKIGVNRFTPEEILERTMAAVSYPREIRDKLLDPNVPREAIKDFLGTTPKIRGGAVSVNPTMEIAGGARASMPGADMEEIETATTGGTGLTYHDTTDLKQFQQKEKLERAGFVYDPNTGNYYSEIDDTEIDPTELMTSVPKNATDYGDTEGVGNLLIETETFRERTNQGTTQIPGAVQQMSGRAPGSERQERFSDVVTPLRRDPSGVQTTGLQVVANPELPFGRQLRSQDTGYRQGNRLVSEDLSTQGTRLVGGFETAQPSVSEFISTVPVTDWRPNGGIIRGADGHLYSAAGQEIVGEQPLLGVRRTPLMAPDPQTGKQRRIGFTTLKTAKLEPLTLSRQELQEVAEDAKDMYFNNPSAKLAYLQERNPQALELGRAQGKTLSEIGEAYDYQGFIANQIDNYLMNNAGIDLPILKPQVSTTTGKPYLPKEGGSFVMNLLKTTKDSPIFGRRFAVDAQGRRIPKRNEAGKIVTNKGGYVEYEFVGDVMPIPGAYETTGGGGVDPMTIGDDYEGGNVSYYTPRIDTASQRKVMGTAKKLGVPAEQMIGATSTPTGTLMSLLRTQAEVKPVGMRVKSPGSFARTQNPYTGSAAAVMGPASRVLSGNYQYTDPQLTVRLEPTSQAQLQQRNQFALAANLTPGGQVVRGQIELGSNLGTIPAGLGSLTETQTVNRYGLTGSQLQQFGNQLMSQAASRRSVPSPAPEPNPLQERNDAIARHIGNYISAASQRMEGPASIQGVKLKGVGQNALRPYQAPSEAMIQQLMRVARRR